MHTNCLKEIEELNFQPTVTQAATGTEKNASEKMEVPVSLVGQKRTYVDAQLSNNGKVGGISAAETDQNKEFKSGDDQQLKGLQDIIRGLNKQKRRRVE